MLTREDNDLLTRIGPGTLMGDLFRQYWLPVLMSSELPEPDGPPKRVRILGEDLIAFRTTSGRVGLLANHCSHRGASLFFGRNEGDGLRCVYHGWKYDVDGHCVDMPNEPAFRWTDSGGRDSPESSGFGAQAEAGRAFSDKIRHTAYPSREVNGTIWAYMGPRKEPPALPGLEWLRVPESQRSVGKTLRECNWLQALEGDIDNAHVPFLHSQLDFRPEEGSATRFYGRPMHLEVAETEYGAMYGVRREGEEGTYNWRIIQFLFPSSSMITIGTPRERGVVPSHMWVPMDDEHTMQWAIKWHPTEPLPEGVSAQTPEDYLPDDSGWLDQWRPTANRTNDYLIDRQVQRTVSFSGIASIPLQDKMATESMGPIVDRAHEHLGTTDAMIMRVRRRLIEAAKSLREKGVPPPGVDRPEIYRVRSAIVDLPKTANWVEATREVVKATAAVAG